MPIKDWRVVKDPVDAALGCIGATAIWVAVVVVFASILAAVVGIL